AHPRRDRGHREHGPSERHVLLGDALLDDVADDDEQDHLEGRHVREGPSAQAPGEGQEEEERDAGPQDDLHLVSPPHGHTRTSTGTSTTTASSSTTATRPDWPHWRPGSVFQSNARTSSSPVGASSSSTVSSPIERSALGSG